MKSIFNKMDLPAPPIIWGEICMCFDYDFDIKFVDNIMGIQQNEAVRKSDTMFNTTTLGTGHTKRIALARLNPKP